MANIKLDVIYYKTPSDFEFEFNLSGCGGVRLFKEKIESPKGLITSLARDVERSRVIIVVADLAEENGGIAAISKAVGLPLVPSNKEEYHITSDGDCKVFKGAIPLVTKSGAFVGFIAESGPQSIIVLTSNRALRHEIMDSYVHKYIFEITQIEVYNQKYNSNPPPQKKQTVADEPESITPETKIDAIDLAPGTSISPLPINYKENDAEDVFLDKRLPKKSNGTNIALLVIVVLLLIAFGVLAYLFIYIPLLNGETPFLSDAVKYFLRR